MSLTFICHILYITAHWNSSFFAYLSFFFSRLEPFYRTTEADWVNSLAQGPNSGKVAEMALDLPIDRRSSEPRDNWKRDIQCATQSLIFFHDVSKEHRHTNTNSIKQPLIILELAYPASVLFFRLADLANIIKQLQSTIIQPQESLLLGFVIDCFFFFFQVVHA